MLLQVLLFVVGLLFVIFGADWLVEGSSSVARKAGISEFVIGLTIVGFGTSMPELVVSLNGALQGLSDISIGNVVGSNIFNTLLILGITAAILPIAISNENRKRDIPINLAATLLLVLYGMRHTLFGIGDGDGISRIGGIVFLIVFIAYLWSCFKFDSKEVGDGDSKTRSIPMAVVLTLAGIAMLIIGGRLFVNSATAIASSFGISDKFIAITVLAGGTSLPELATCVVAAAKKKGQLALGNILGSNVFNILLILGVSASVHPVSFSNMNFVDMGVLLASVIMLLAFAYTGKKNRIDRWEGVLLLLVEAAYFIWLCIKL